ncbi:MAG: hypothetical protein FH756_16110 [Firmicutes bacterium]|nr:hypothetical protein [Bacillota bacterium]
MSMVNKSNMVLLYSGGIDSTVLLHRLLLENWDVHPLHVNYGQVTAYKELDAIKRITSCKLKNKLMKINIEEVHEIGAGSLIGNYPDKVYSTNDWHEKEYFPNRNLILTIIAATYCYKISCSNLAIGIVGESSYIDTKIKYLKSVESILAPVGSNPIKIYAPYAELPRIKVVEDAVRFNVDIEKTFSCNALDDRHCYYCNSCKEREEALNIYQRLKKGSGILKVE